MINYNILGSASKTYKDILDERIRIKHTEPERQAGLKLILNSVYGLLKSEYSLLYNPKASTTVCAIGQCLLYDLAKRLEPSCTICQLNTDGIMMVPHNDDYKRVWKEWENDWNLTLEEERYAKLWHRDVNNYIGLTPDGKIKTKGGDVSRYSKDKPFANNSARILDIALVNHLVYGKDVIETLIENLDQPKLYQYVLQAGSTYKGTFDKQGNQYNKINRVFPTKKGDTCLFKLRHDGGYVKFADAPEKMFVWNDDVSKIENFAGIVDINHYYQIIQKRLEKWL